MKVAVTVAVTKDIVNYNSIATTAQIQIAGSEESIRRALDNFSVYTLLREALSDLKNKEEAAREILEKINNESA